MSTEVRFYCINSDLSLVCSHLKIRLSSLGAKPSEVGHYSLKCERSHGYSPLAWTNTEAQNQLEFSKDVEGLMILFWPSITQWPCLNATSPSLDSILPWRQDVSDYMNLPKYNGHFPLSFQLQHILGSSIHNKLVINECNDEKHAFSIFCCTFNRSRSKGHKAKH